MHIECSELAWEISVTETPTFLSAANSRSAVPGTPIMMSDSKVPVQTAPVHGGNNEEIYGDWLGISVEEVQKMRADNVI